MTELPPLPPFSAIMLTIGQNYVLWDYLVMLRKHLLYIHQSFNRQYDLRALAMAALILLEDGDSVGYILGMKPDRFYQKARQVLDARFLEIVRMDGQGSKPQ